MSHPSSEYHVNVADLKVGMFVHLDRGWMSHPFPLGSFKIAGAEQIATIRGLGLQRLRWSPEKSDLFDEPRTLPPGAGVGLATLTGGEGVTLERTAAAASESAEPASPDAALLERDRRRAALAAERDAHRACERRFSEVSGRCRQTLQLAARQPEKAGEQADALTRELVGHLLNDREMSIRLLSENASDRYTAHAMNVAVISLLMGRVFGLAEDEMYDLGIGALMHDIGKLALPERVRHNDEHLTPNEAVYYREHVAEGVSAGRRMRLRSGALLVIGQHHEHVDGTGFPLGLKGERMSTAARIVALVNRYDNLCNPAVPSKGLTPHEALSLLFAQWRDRFDTAIMGAFIRMMGVYPPGSTVQLTDDRYGIVTTVNSSRPLKPRVLVHDPGALSEHAQLIDLEKAPGVGIRRSLKPLQLPSAALSCLSPRQRVVYFFEPAMAVEPVGEAIA